MMMRFMGESVTEEEIEVSLNSGLKIYIIKGIVFLDFRPQGLYSLNWPPELNYNFSDDFKFSEII
jgi:hypothetical protein